MYLLDTNVVSATAPTKALEYPALIDWVRKAGEGLFLSVATSAEIIRGVVKLERDGAERKAEALRRWWGQIEHLYSDRVLAFDLRAAHAAGIILDRARAHSPGFVDVAIAATAEVNGLTVLTTNERHFRPFGVAYINPLVTLPPLPEDIRR